MPDTDLSSREALAAVNDGHEQAARDIVPWFFENMPDYYFRTHPKEEIVKHLHAMISGRLTGESQTVVLTSPCKTFMTFVTPGKWIKELLAVLDPLDSTPLQTLRMMTSRDEKLRLTDVEIAPKPRADRKSGAWRKAVLALEPELGLTGEAARDFKRFLATASQDYVEKFEPARALRHYKAIKRLEGREQAEVRLEELGENSQRITVNMVDPPTDGLYPRLVRIMARRSLDIDRAYADLFVDEGKTCLLASFYVHCDEECLVRESERWHYIRQDLMRVKWVAPHALEELAANRGWNLPRIELLQACCEFAHQFLIKKDLYAFTSDNVVRAALKNPELSLRLVEYFEARFDPAPGAAGEKSAHEAFAEGLAEVQSKAARTVFEKMGELVRKTLRTNYFRVERAGLCFRLDTSVLEEPIMGEWPYGIFFFHGPRSLGFHVRFRDTARGGLRIVRSGTQAGFELESNRLFDEAAALARTQQDKNKDIPEGGAKAVLLLGPGGNTDLALHAMIDAFLDVILPGEDAPTLPEIKDYVGRREIIYLGPDENITPAHIEWIVARAERRGYPTAQAFMSSKPETGINHKRYGVTSLGVVVFTEEILRYLDIDPYEEPFTVKLTGGPRGDVASNALAIMFEKYGDNAKILSMSDGSGAAFDPAGLDHGELMRLVAAESSIAAFDPARLSGRGAFVLPADTPENARIRNSLHNTVNADVFIPAGGRPDTINDDNWREFLDDKGVPTARAMVEGANIFISAGARAKLEEQGVLCIQGSSANKTGVICSSYEILAALTLSEQEFRRIKKTYVRDVLAILEKRARDEARLLIREHKLCGGERSLTDISREISRQINSLADEIVSYLHESPREVRENENLQRLVLEYCPAVLAEHYPERIMEQVPSAHRFALLGHFIAARIVYAEGLGWLERINQVRELREVVEVYLEQESKVAEICSRLSKSRLSDREALARIVRTAGLKQLTMERLGLA